MSLSTLLLLAMLVLVFRFIIMGVPVMLCLLGIPIIVAAFGSLVGAFDIALLGAIPTRINGILTNQLLYAVPLFVLLGKLLQHSGFAEGLLVSLSGVFKNRVSSLAYCVLAVSVVLAMSSGIVGATITMLAAIAVPVMLKTGYGEQFSAGLVCAAGSLGQILPPSIVLILLSDQVSNAYISSQLASGNFSPDPVSIGHLFAASIIPGLILACAYGLYIAFQSRRVGYAEREETQMQGVGGQSMLLSLVVLLTLTSIPAAIILGVTSATESAVLGVVLIVACVLLSGKRSTLFVAFREAVEITGVIFGIILAASVFALVMRGFGGDELLVSFFSDLPGGFYVPLLLVMMIVFFLGFIMEFVEITYIIVPVTAPVLFGLGIDPIWFAILMAVNLQISFLTPPFGIALFYYKGVQNIEMPRLSQAIIPFVLIQIMVLGLLVVFPCLATWLPGIIL